MSMIQLAKPSKPRQTEANVFSLFLMSCKNWPLVQQNDGYGAVALSQGACDTYTRQLISSQKHIKLINPICRSAFGKLPLLAAFGLFETP